jgi:hypothetical protein
LLPLMASFSRILPPGSWRRSRFLRYVTENWLISRNDILLVK